MAPCLSCRIFQSIKIQTWHIQQSEILVSFEAKAGPISLYRVKDHHFLQVISIYYLVDGAMDHQLCAIHSFTGGPWIHLFFGWENFTPKSKPPGDARWMQEYQLVNFSAIFPSKFHPKLLRGDVSDFPRKVLIYITWLRTVGPMFFPLGFQKPTFFERFFYGFHHLFFFAVPFKTW